MDPASRGLLASPLELLSSREIERGSRVGLEPSVELQAPAPSVRGGGASCRVERTRHGHGSSVSGFEDYSFPTSALYVKVFPSGLEALAQGGGCDAEGLSYEDVFISLSQRSMSPRSGRTSYRYEYLIALRCFMAKYLGISVEEDPFAQELEVVPRCTLAWFGDALCRSEVLLRRVRVLHKQSAGGYGTVVKLVI
ncbi:hypothetical protein BHE74_00002716 [Ensete ventricosum]|nr:hypothetical protein BHE74_00002716 [Ensete ventricosum]